jgi:hypothetical protein
VPRIHPDCARLQTQAQANLQLLKLSPLPRTLTRSPAAYSRLAEVLLLNKTDSRIETQSFVRFFKDLPTTSKFCNSAPRRIENLTRKRRRRLAIANGRLPVIVNRRNSIQEVETNSLTPIGNRQSQIGNAPPSHQHAPHVLASKGRHHYQIAFFNLPRFHAFVNAIDRSR